MRVTSCPEPCYQAMIRACLSWHFLHAGFCLHFEKELRKFNLNYSLKLIEWDMGLKLSGVLVETI